MFLITWVFDKLGFIPKPKENAFNEAVATAWPFPGQTLKAKPTVKKATTRKPRTTAKKPVVVAKTARKKAK